MPDFSHDRLCGAQTMQDTHEGIYASIKLPSNIVLGPDPDPVTGEENWDYVNFYLIYNHYVEAGISYAPNGVGFKIFMGTGIFQSNDYDKHWKSKTVGELGLNIGFGDTVTMRLEPNGARTKLFINGILIYDMENFQTQPLKAQVGYNHGCQDKQGYVQHNTATWSNIHLKRSGKWVPWDVPTWGYYTIRTRTAPYGILTAHPTSAYLAKPNGRDPATDE